MTPFAKEDFNWDGEYLTYSGAYNGCKMMMEVNPNAHPSWEGKRYPKFVARFKNNKGQRRRFQKFLIENFSCEEYFKAAEATGRNPGASTQIMVISIILAALAEGITFFAIFLAK